MDEPARTAETPTSPNDAERVRAVWRIYRRRGGRGDIRTRAYPIYVAAVAVALYLLPMLYLAGSVAPRWGRTVPPDALLLGGHLAIILAVVTAQLAGRVGGPLVVSPFVAHVLISTDLPPQRFLGRLALRRLVILTAVVSLPLVVVAVAMTGGLDDIASAVVILLSGIHLGAGLAAVWLWAQTRSLASTIGLSVVIVAFLVAATVVARVTGEIVSVPLVAVLAGGLPGSPGVTIWSSLVVQIAATTALGWAAWSAIRAVDLPRWAAESVRVAQAQVFVGSGTFHDALDLYRPQPAGLAGALIRSNGRLRGHLLRGAIRSVRTPWRTVAAGVLVMGGPFIMVLGAGWTSDTDSAVASAACVMGAVMVYLGVGSVTESWRGLRDELALPPLLGGWDGGALGRGLLWPLAVVLAGGLIGSVLAVAATVVGGVGSLSPTPRLVSLVAGSLVLALAARFLREMKTQLPIELLTPIITPFGDAAGARLLAWQFDGFLFVLLSVTVLSEIGSAVLSWLAVVVAAGWCLRQGLARVGWSVTSSRRRLRREASVVG